MTGAIILDNLVSWGEGREGLSRTGRFQVSFKRLQTSDMRALQSKESNRVTFNKNRISGATSQEKAGPLAAGGKLHGFFVNARVNELA